MTAPQPVLEPGTDVSRYRVEKLVAQGGMGLVYRARDLRLDRPVALKVLSPALSGDDRFRERFVRESRLAAAVDHPNVIPVYEADDWHGLLYLAMRFVDGVDLHTVLSASGPMTPVTALPLLDQAAAALDAAHRVGLVHRDVKPGNLMLAGASPDSVPPGTHVYLTDFGLTKRATSMSGLTRTGQFLGSLHYVAPEQVRPSHRPSPAPARTSPRPSTPCSPGRWRRSRPTGRRAVARSSRPYGPPCPTSPLPAMPVAPRPPLRPAGGRVGVPSAGPPPRPSSGGPRSLRSAPWIPPRGHPKAGPGHGPGPSPPWG